MNLSPHLHSAALGIVSASARSSTRKDCLPQRTVQADAETHTCASYCIAKRMAASSDSPDLSGRSRRGAGAERRERLRPGCVGRRAVSRTIGRLRAQLPRAAEPPCRHLGDLAMQDSGAGIASSSQGLRQGTRWTRSSTPTDIGPTLTAASRNSAAES
jgi:hypothetical protein